MARYIDADKLIAEIEENINTYWNEGAGGYYLAEDALNYSVKTEPTADVVPKSEYDAVVSAVDNSTKEFLKLHDAYQNAKAEIDELKKDRYQVLPDGRLELLPRTDIDKIKAEVAMEIFAEIEEGIKAAISALQFASAFHRGAKHEAYSSVMRFIKTIEKKYTPQCTTCKHMLSCEPSVLGICDEYEEKKDD